MMEQALNIAKNDAFRFRGWHQHLPFIYAGYQFGEFRLLKGSNRGHEDRISGTYSVQARYPLFAWGAISAEKKALFLREKNAMQHATNTWRILLEEIRSDFYHAVTLKGAIALLEKQIAHEKLRVSRSSAHTTEGYIAETNALSLEISIREKEYSLNAQHNELDVALSRLRSTTGLHELTQKDIPDFVSCPDIDPDILEKRIATFNALNNRTTGEAILAQNQRALIDEEITQVEARMLPNLNLGASVSQSPYQTNTNRFEMQTVLFAGISGTWNIFDRDATNTTVRALKTEQRLIDARLRASRQTRFDALRTQVRQIRDSRAMLALRNERLKAAELYLDGLRHSHALGITEELAVKDAELSAEIHRQSIRNNQTTITRALRRFLSGIEQDPAAALYSAPSND
jgi:outer membrane protein TolC